MLRRWDARAHTNAYAHSDADTDTHPNADAGPWGDVFRLHDERAGSGLDLRERGLGAPRPSARGGLFRRRDAGPNAHTHTNADTHANAITNARRDVLRLHDERAGAGLDLRQRRLGAPRSSPRGKLFGHGRHAHADTHTNAHADAHADTDA